MTREAGLKEGFSRRGGFHVDLSKVSKRVTWILGEGGVGSAKALRLELSEAGRRLAGRADHGPWCLMGSLASAEVL